MSGGSDAQPFIDLPGIGENDAAPGSSSSRARSSSNSRTTHRSSYRPVAMFPPTNSAG